MAMFKEAQMMDELVIELPEEFHPQHEETILLVSPEEAEELQVKMDEPEDEAKAELSFKLPFLPGAPEVLEVSSDDLDTKEEEKEEKKDKSKAADQPRDLNWVKEYLDNIPKHKGETIGLERAKSYLNRANDSLSKMLQNDYDGKIDISKAEEARVEIENGINRLDKELARRKKASQDNGMTKEAQKAGGVISGGVMVTVPLIVSSIARTCINSTVSGGKDITHTFQRLAEKFKLNDREKMEVVQLLSDMNFPIRRDFGFMIDDEEKFDPRSSHNYNYQANYQS